MKRYYQVVNFVRHNMETSDDLSAICERLVERCKELSHDVTNELPQDNMTVMVAILK